MSLQKYKTKAFRTSLIELIRCALHINSKPQHTD